MKQTPDGEKESEFRGVQWERRPRERERRRWLIFIPKMSDAGPRRNANLSCTLCGSEKKLFTGARFEQSGVCEWNPHSALRPTATWRFCQPLAKLTLIITTEMINQLNKHEQSNNSNQKAQKKSWWIHMKSLSMDLNGQFSCITEIRRSEICRRGKTLFNFYKRNWKQEDTLTN